MWLMRRTSLATRLGLSNAEVAGYAGGFGAIADLVKMLGYSVGSRLSVTLS